MVRNPIGPIKYAPMSLKDFDKMVRSWGYSMEAIAKHHRVIDSAGETVITFAVTHRKGQRQLVLPIYQRQFIKAMGFLES